MIILDNSNFLPVPVTNIPGLHRHA